ncbi:MAG: Ig-like domain-containing protein [Kofleriaceae bacterium]
MGKMGKWSVVGVWVGALVLGACGDNIGAHVDVSRDDVRVPVGATVRNEVTVQAGYSPRGAVRQWTIDNGMIADIDDDGQNLHVTGRTPGETTVHFRYGDAEKDIGVEVSDAQPASLRVEPTDMQLPLGMSAKLVPIATYTDGKDYDVGDSVNWNFDEPDVLNFSDDMITGTALGTTKVHAELDDLDAYSQISVTNAQVTRLVLDPDSLTLPLGTVGYFHATGIFDDGTTTDLTTAATWSSDDTSIAAVIAGNTTGTGAGSTTVHASYGAASADAAVTVTNTTLSVLTVDPAFATVPAGAALQYHAMGHFADGTALDMTKQVAWAVDAHAMIDVNGKATTSDTGVAHVTATYGASTGAAVLNVSSAHGLRLVVSEHDVIMQLATQHQLQATAFFDDSTVLDVTNVASWTSSDPSVAVNGGMLTAKSTGASTVTASFLGLTDQAMVSVDGAALASLDVSPAQATIPALTKISLVATAHYADGTSADVTTIAAWSSDAPLTAYVGNAPGYDGQVHGLIVGDANITAAVAGRTATAKIHVSAAIATQLTVTPSVVSLPKGTFTQLTATAVYSDNSTLDVTNQVAWTSSNLLVASVSNVNPQQGQATGIAAGQATITATYGTLSASGSLTITAAHVQSLVIEPGSLTLGKLQIGQLTAEATYDDQSVVDVTNQCVWTSDSSNVTVSTLVLPGKVVGVNPGTADVSCAFSGKSATAEVTVTSSFLASITAAPNPLTVAKAASKQLTVTGVYSDLSTTDITSTASFVSSNPAVLTVSPSGLATGVAAGTATITVTAQGQMTTVLATVTPAILVSLAVAGGDVSLPKGVKLPLVAIGTYSDGTTADITPNVSFTSDNVNVASVSNVAGDVGLLSANAQGTANVTAHVGDLDATVKVNVSGAQLSGIDVQATADNLLVAQVQAYTALGHYTDGTTQDLTNQVSWGSSSPSILSISNLPGLNGKALALGLGQTNVTAALGTVLGTKAVTVGAGCHLVINEIKTGALLNGKDEFVEIYNPCTVTLSTEGDTLVYRPTLSSTDTVMVTLTGGNVAPGGYLLFAGSAYSGAPQADGSYTVDLPALAGSVALKSSSSVIDGVGYGVGVTAYVEGAPALQAALGSSIARKPNGTDTNSNLTDFAVQAPTPRAAN